MRAVVITGDEKAFAAGADIREMAESGPIEVLQRRTAALWAVIAACPKPVIAAVNGYALGGGCELAMHADIIIAGEGAVFGQPEVKVGIIPGSGGTQRLMRAVGKFKAMKLILTGEPIKAAEAERIGLVSEVVPDADVLPRALELAATIAALPPLAVQQIKEVMLAGADAPLSVGAGAGDAGEPAALRLGGPEGRDARVPGEAEAGVQGAVSFGHQNRQAESQRFTRQGMELCRAGLRRIPPRIKEGWSLRYSDRSQIQSLPKSRRKMLEVAIQHSTREPCRSRVRHHSSCPEMLSLFVQRYYRSHGRQPSNESA